MSFVVMILVGEKTVCTYKSAGRRQPRSFSPNTFRFILAAEQQRKRKCSEVQVEPARLKTPLLAALDDYQAGKEPNPHPISPVVGQAMPHPVSPVKRDDTNEFPAHPISPVKRDESQLSFPWVLVRPVGTLIKAQ
jgi:hypothetical protein